MSATEHEYKRLIGKLGGNKSFLTKKANTVAAWCEVQDLEGEELIEASQLKVTIEERLVLLQGLFDEILGLPEVTDQDIEDFETYERDIRKKLAKLKHKLVLSQPVPISPADDPDRTIPVSPRSGDAQSTLDGAVKYPEIKLPTFSGGSSGTKNFTPFYQLFKALVEDKTDIPQIYKVQYLRECLPERSEARELIDYIPPVAENYDLIMASLKSRYDDKTGEANKLRRSLRQIASWSVANSLESQRKLVDHVRQTISLLEQVDTITPDDMKGLSLDILSVLPERLKYKVCEWEQRERTVKAIITLLESSIKSKLEVRSLTDSCNKPESSRPKHTTPKPSNSYFTCHNSGNTNTQSSELCLYCGGDHVPHNCTQKSRDERVAIVTETKRCWNCLGQHQVRNCRVPSRCPCKKGKHSKSLCGALPPWKRAKKQGTAYVATESVDVSLVSPGVGTVSYLSSLVIELPAKSGGTEKVRFLLDGCATHTYGLESCVSRLKTTDRGKKIDMTVSSFNGPRQVSARLVELELPNCTPLNIIVTDYICEPLQGHNLESSLKERLQEYPLGDPSCITGESLPIDILVGVDNFWKIVTDQIIRLTSGLIVMSSKFGYILSGEISVPGRSVTSGAYIAHTLLSPCATVQELHAPDTWYQYAHTLCSTSLPTDSDMDEVMCQLEKFWDLDTLGIKPDREISPVLEEFSHTLTQDPESGRYTCSLPRKRNIVNLPSNYTSCLRRLDSLQAKMKRPGNKDFARKYSAVINDQIEKGIIEKVEMSDSHREKLLKYPSLCCGEFYIPHHGVLTKVKLRVVYDGSAKAYKGALELNGCLFVGPSLVNLLAEVSLSFRLHTIALIADIERAFLNIGVVESDRDLLRFLWYNEEGKLETYRFTRVPFGTGPSPFLLNATLKHHFMEVVKDPELLALILRSIYVDDILAGGETPERVLELKSELENILGKAAMNLHGFDSNSLEVRQSLGVENTEDEKKVLGIMWNRRSDTLGLNLEKLCDNVNRGSTKRELLRATAQMFDPHGLYSPVVLVPKLLFQKLCSRKYKLGWDDPLPEDVDRVWREWLDQIPFLEGVRVQRHVLLPEYDRLELHGFSDASQSAYAATVYIKSSRGSKSACHLIMCKSRVAPQKDFTIPRLELMGAVLLARLMATVVAFLKHLKFEAIVYYTDSMNVLHWIRTEHRLWSVFVACRIKEINSLSNFTDWNYVPTDKNPADPPTRGLKVCDLSENKLWFHGPDFLVEGHTLPEVDSSHPPPACLQERKKMVMVAMPVRTGVGTVIKCEDFSTAHKLFSRTVCWLRVIYWLAKKHLKNAGDRFDFSRPELYSQARLLWLKYVQAEHYSVEIKFCQNMTSPRIPVGMKVPSSILKQLDLSLDQNGLLHVGTRLKHAPIPEAAKSPILLPSDSYLSKLFIKDTHQRLMHSGVRQVMDSIRGWSWIPQCRRTISKILRACVNCRKFQADFYPAPDPPPLPDFRVQKVDAWETIGVDHCGPFLAYPKPVFSTAKRGKPVKVYVLIFTCAVTRGVNLELVEDMSVESFMLGFRRFVSSHGLPSYILSDNGSTFVCAGKELTAILNDPKFQRYMGSRNIKWEHYLEYAPWWGGWIERLNRIFKSSLRKVLGGACVAMWEFYTFLKECEAVMNSRPLTYVYDDVQEGQAITPSMLWCGKDLTQLPPDMFTFRFGRKAPMTCKERLKHLSKRKTYFKTRFLKEYLTGLTERHATSRHGFDVREPKVGDTVLINDKASSKVKIPRNRWNLGRILTLHPGRDGKVRSVDVRMVVDKGEEPCVLRHKSPSQLVPLEAGDDSFW